MDMLVEVTYVLLVLPIGMECFNTDISKVL